MPVFSPSPRFLCLLCAGGRGCPPGTGPLSSTQYSWSYRQQVLLLYKEVLPPWSDPMGYGREASSLGFCPHSCFPLHSSLSHEDYSSPGQIRPQTLSSCHQVPPPLPSWPYSGEHSFSEPPDCTSWGPTLLQPLPCSMITQTPYRWEGPS